MKKFYTLFLASAVAFGVSADMLAADGLRTDFSPSKVRLQSKLMAVSDNYNVERNAAVVRGLRKIDENASSMAGKWTLNFGDYYFNDSKHTSIQVVYNAKVEGNRVTFTPVNNNYQPFIGTFDPETNIITFDNEYVGLINKYYAYQEPYVYNFDTQRLDEQPIKAYFNKDAGNMVFYGDSGISWGAYTSEAGLPQTNQGYLNIFDFEAAVMEGNWENFGDALFTDGWLIPGTGQNQRDESYYLAIQRNRNNQNVYRLVDPYFDGMMMEFNTSVLGGYIVFDVSDPNHVVFIMSDAGFTNEPMNLIKFYPNNRLGRFVTLNPDMTLQELIDYFDNPSRPTHIPYSIFDDGVVTVGSIFDNGAVAYDAIFGFQGDPTAQYQWTMENSNETANMFGQIDIIEISGVEGIGADSDVAPVYYNIQGLRVNNPEPGELLIKVQGSKSSKVIFR